MGTFAQRLLIDLLNYRPSGHLKQAWKLRLQHPRGHLSNRRFSEPKPCTWRVDRKLRTSANPRGASANKMVPLLTANLVTDSVEEAIAHIQKHAIEAFHLYRRGIAIKRSWLLRE